MKTLGTFEFEILTDMFSGGATPHESAELRVPAIRGVLRWWFRALGGFKSSALPLHEQEKALFGGVHGDKAVRSALMVRVLTPLESQKRTDANDYFLWPTRNNAHAHIPHASTFTLAFYLNDSQNKVSETDILALITVFGELGSMGFRSRRCYGAIAFKEKAPMSLKEAFTHFKHPENIQIYKHKSVAQTTTALIQTARNWLQGWRSFGPSNHRNTSGTGFEYAKSDHNVLYGSKKDPTKLFRPALGMPMNTKYGNVNGRFASPVILRPAKVAEQQYELRILFVEIYAWDAEKGVEIAKNKIRTAKLSLDLYDAMKCDKNLTLLSFT